MRRDDRPEGSTASSYSSSTSTSSSNSDTESEGSGSAARDSDGEDIFLAASMAHPVVRALLAGPSSDAYTGNTRIIAKHSNSSSFSQLCLALLLTQRLPLLKSWGARLSSHGTPA